MGNSLNSRFEIETLPDEILIKIFQQLSVEDLFFAVPRTCKQFNRVSQDNSIWIRFAHNNWKNEKNLKAAYLNWIRGQVYNYLNKENNWFTSGCGISWEDMVSKRQTPIDPNEVRAYDFLQKILMVGESNSGKSSLILRFCDNKFSQNYYTTIGIDFKLKTIELAERKLKLKLQIWDTGSGRERFRTITSTNYRGAHGIAIVFDIANRDSFTHVENYLQDIDRYAQINIPKILIGNKCDLDRTRVITTEEAKQYAKERNLQYVEASAKDNINVSETFTNLANIISDGNYDGIIPKVTPSKSFFIAQCTRKSIKAKKRQTSTIICSTQ